MGRIVQPNRRMHSMVSTFVKFRRRVCHHWLIFYPCRSKKKGNKSYPSVKIFRGLSDMKYSITVFNPVLRFGFRQLNGSYYFDGTILMSSEKPYWVGGTSYTSGFPPTCLTLRESFLLSLFTDNLTVGYHRQCANGS